MVKRGKSRSKEGTLTNIPEEGNTVLLSPRYLAIATSLVLVFSAFASVLVQNDITGQVTGITQKWRDQGLVKVWGQHNVANIDERDNQGRLITPPEYTCPKKALPAPRHLASTSNGECYNADKQVSQFLPMCMYEEEVDGKLQVKAIKCVRQ